MEGDRADPRDRRLKHEGVAEIAAEDEARVGQELRSSGWSRP